MKWIDVLDANRLGEGAREVVRVDGRPVLLVRHQGQVYAVAAKCPHMGAPLEKGRITDDGAIVCPLHRSAFDLVQAMSRTGHPGPRLSAPSWALCGGNGRSPSSRSKWRAAAYGWE
jgi:nitrite reductase/ring-hydroxylating ferredoxin subunit